MERTGQLLASYLWKQRNKERCAQQRKEWREANPERHAEINRRSTKNNRSAHNARTQKYNATKLGAKPSWANESKMKEFYETADALGMWTGDWYTVDHIVPLRGKTVCGFHTEHNFQILLKQENSSKGNRYWPDMPT